MPHLGYGRWENFNNAMGRAMESCISSGTEVMDHFREDMKMISKGDVALFGGNTTQQMKEAPWDLVFLGLGLVSRR